MIARIVIAALLAAAFLPPRVHADSVSSSEPVERLSCGDVFDGEGVSPAYVQRIVGFAFPPGASGTAHLAKWTQGWRLLLRTEAVPQDFVLDTVTAFRAALPRQEGVSPVAQFDWNDRARVRDGDLVIYLTWWRGEARDVAGQRFAALVEEVRGPEPSARIEPVLGAVDHLPFVGIVRSAEGAVRRAIVVMDLDYAQLGGQPAVFEFLTTALNPNAGNALYLGLPGSKPAEKLIYEKTWRSSVKYDLSWTREFETYLRVMIQEAVTPGMNAAQFSEVAAQMLSEPEMKQRVAKLYGCELDSD